MLKDIEKKVKAMSILQIISEKPTSGHTNSETKVSPWHCKIYRFRLLDTYQVLYSQLNIFYSVTHQVINTDCATVAISLFLINNKKRISVFHY